MYDENDNDHAAPPESAPPSQPLTITISGYQACALIDEVVARVHENAHDQIKDAVRGAIKEAVDKAATSIAREELLPIVRATIEEGWQPTSEYGRPAGPKQTVADIVLQQLRKPGDNYRPEKGNWIHQLVYDMANKALVETFAKEIEAARVAFRQHVDSMLQDKLRQSLAGALGIK